MNKREANGSKNGGPGNRGQEVVLGALRRTLKYTRSGRRLDRFQSLFYFVNITVKLARLEETRQVEPGGDIGEEEGTGVFGICV